MNNIIGFKDTETIRLNTWLKMIESKKSYEAFRLGSSEQEKNIASLDKQLYNYYLSNYVKGA